MTKRKTRKQITKDKSRVTQLISKIYKPPIPDTEPRNKKHCVVCVETPCWEVKKVASETSCPKPEVVSEHQKNKFLEVTGAVRIYADLFRDQFENDCEIYELNEKMPQVGDFVRMKNMTDNKYFNGKTGVITKLKGNLFLISTMHGFFSMPRANFDITKSSLCFEECQNSEFEGIDHEVYKPEAVEPKVGDFVRFKNFVEKKRFNGKLGLVKKELGESRFQIATMNDAFDFSISIENFDIIKNCNAENNRMEIGEMIWPKIKGLNVRVDGVENRV